MRDTKTSALFALLGLHAVAVYAGPTCFSRQPGTVGGEATSKEFLESIEEAVYNVCHTGKTTHVQNEATTLTIERNTPGNVDQCITNFSNIITQCMKTQHGNGGLIKDEADGSEYKISSNENNSTGENTANITSEQLSPVWPREESGAMILEARDPRGGSRGSSRGGSRGGSRPGRPPKHTPKPGKTTSARPTSTHHSSSSQAAKPTITCKKLYAQLMKEAREEGFVQKRETSPVHLEKRYKPKPGSACGVTLDANEYPDKREMAAARKNELWYGFKEPAVCTNYVFRAANGPATGIPGSDYHLEHVLEWQVVTHFFDWIKDKKKTGNVFDNPDPSAANKKIDFCKYWEATWTPSEGKSDLPEFSLDSKPGNSKLPLNHLKDAYPGRSGKGAGAVNQFFEDFVYLHGLNNNPAKANMWSTKSDASAGIFKVGKMEKACKSKTVNVAKKCHGNLRNLLGARKYMADKKVAGILKRQKVRVGKMLAELDTEMVRHPKTGFTAWQPQGLEQLWDDYMDEKFKEAKRRTETEMEKYLAEMVRVWTPIKAKSQVNKAFFKDLTQLKTMWAQEKVRPWLRPW